MHKNKTKLKTREIVEDIFIEHPTWNARQIYNAYCRIQPKEFQVDKPAIQKAVGELKKKYDEIHESGLDSPWSMGGYAHNGFESQFKLTSEENLAILRVRHMQLYRDNIVKRMSTRQALWIARLYAIVDVIHSDKTLDEKAYWLWMYSFQYAIREKVAKLKKQIFNSRELDDMLLEGHEKFKAFYEKDSYHHWEVYERFYTSHIFGEKENIKDGEN